MSEMGRGSIFVAMNTTLGTVGASYVAGEIYDIPETTAASWICNGVASLSLTPTKEIQSLLARLDEGADEPVIFPPFIGEFGHLIMSHIRLVHFHKSAYKIVCCRPGEEVLFPSAAEFVTEWADPLPDLDKVGTCRSQRFQWDAIQARFPGVRMLQSGGLTMAQEIWAIEPDHPILFRPKRRGLYADVCLGVREREFCPERNWRHWQKLAHRLMAHGYRFAVIGKKPTAPDLADQTHHSDGSVDAAIELLQGCRLYIGQDSGNSHLAACVGAPMLVFREESGGSRNLVTRMQEVNPQPIQLIQGAWEQPEAVIEAAIQRLNRR